MCGIAGMLNCDDFCRRSGVTDTAGEMAERLKRRGPDQDGVYFRRDCALVHTRLAVVDIENGIQPMVFADGENEFALVYNGELYNTDEVREKLRSLGHTFNGHSDTEVVLKAYIQWRDACVDEFNGIFAFAVWENAAKKLFFARDRMGVKPFFYAVRGNKFIFSSELKGILAHPLVKAEIDAESIAEVMLVGPGRTAGYGIFKDIAELPAGYLGTFIDGKLTVRRYWDVTDADNTDTFDQTLEKVRFLVTDAIRRQTVSDVPLCTFLSGGLDSSIISAVTAREFKKLGRELHTFSVDYRDNDKYFTASKFYRARMIITSGKWRSTSAAHIISSALTRRSWWKACSVRVDARDLPAMADVDGSLLLFCNEVKKHCTVALSGECADEIFGGYPWYRDKDIRATDGFPWSQSTVYRASLLQDEFASKVNPEKFVYGKYAATIAKVKPSAAVTSLERRMREMMRLNLEWFMQTLLDRKDRMSMYYGLEVRVPFCDYRIVEYLYTVPWEYKDYLGREKGLLRKAMEDILPEEILWRKKSPYPKTYNPNYTAAVSKLLREVIENASSPLLRIVKKAEVEKLLDSTKQTYWYGQLMTNPQIIAYLLQVNYWLCAYKIQIV
ncbi:MAG: asparagine synthase (glutamine-hydrolyzing) [Oscillospiraceae bacterium]